MRKFFEHILFGRRETPEQAPLTAKEEQGLAALASLRGNVGPRREALAPKNINTDPPIIVDPTDINSIMSSMR